MNKFAYLVDSVQTHAAGGDRPANINLEFEKILDAFELHFHYDRKSARSEADLARAKTIAAAAVNDSRLSEDMKELVKKDIINKTTVIGIHDYITNHCSSAF